MTELDYATAAFAAVVLVCAYTVRGIVGFGSGLISVPLLALFFPLQAVVPLVVLLDFLGSASQGVRNRELIAWREQLPLIPFSFVGIGLGLTILTAMASDTLAIALGVFVILYAVYQLLPLPNLRGPRLFAAPLGVLGGLVGTLFGTGGPFYIIYLGLRGLEKSPMRATFAVNFLIDGGIRLAGYAVVGLFDRDLAIAILYALPFAAAGLWVGGRLHAGIPPVVFTRLISALLVVSGIALILKN